MRYGEVYGLLGANGAGKTTTIKMLCGLLEPSEGEVQLAGETRRPPLRRRCGSSVGYMSQKFSLYDDLTIDENLDFFAGVYGVPAERARERKSWVLRVRRPCRAGRPAHGQPARRMEAARRFGAAIMHEPRVLFLDEPTSGVDPIARRASGP